MEIIEIQLSKTKVILGTIVSILFVLLGIYLLSGNFIPPFLNPILAKIVAVSTIAFFGTAAVYGIKKMFDEKIGLTIDDKGIFDNTNASSIGLIEWTNITEITVEKISSEKFIMIHVKEPEIYINKAKGLKKKLMQLNNKQYGTPISITSNTLKCKFSYLEEQINYGLNKWHNKK